MEERRIGLLIATIGMLGATPDALLLRLQETAGGRESLITLWRFVMVGTLNLVLAVVTSGGVARLYRTSAVVPMQLLLAASFGAISNIGFVFSLLKVDPAKALLLISLNPIWAALMGKILLGDVLPTRTVIAQVFAFISICIVIFPNVAALLWPNRHVLGIPPPPSSNEDELYDLVPFITGVAMAAFLTLARSVSISHPAGSLEAAPPIASYLTAMVALNLAHEDGVTSYTDGLHPLFWLYLLVNGVGVAAYNAALVVAPQYLTGAEVALVLLGETVLGPAWVFFVFGDVPSVWTMVGGAVLIATLVCHEVAAVLDESGNGKYDGGGKHEGGISHSSSTSSLTHGITRASYYSPKVSRVHEVHDDDYHEHTSHRIPIGTLQRPPMLVNAGGSGERREGYAPCKLTL